MIQYILDVPFLSPKVLLAAIIATGLLTMATVWVLGRGKAWWGVVLRSICVVCTVVACVATAGLMMNFKKGYVNDLQSILNMMKTYDEGPVEPVEVAAEARSEIEIAGKKIAVLPEAVAAQPSDPQWTPDFFPVTPQTFYTEFTGPRSGITNPVDVWVPRGYEPNDGKTYNVLVMLHGYPGSHYGVLEGLSLEDSVQPLIDSGKIPPTIIVVPDVNAEDREPDCIDLKGRPQIQTWVVDDIVTMIRSAFPNVTERVSGWMMSGLSSGAYCAAETAISYPARFVGSISIGGYDVPESGALIFGGPELRDKYTISSMLAAAGDLPVNLYLTGSVDDVQSAQVARNCADKARPGDNIAQAIESEGGHNWTIWKKHISNAIVWWAELQREMDGGH